MTTSALSAYSAVPSFTPPADPYQGAGFGFDPYQYDAYAPPFAPPGVGQGDWSGVAQSSGSYQGAYGAPAPWMPVQGSPFQYSSPVQQGPPAKGEPAPVKTDVSPAQGGPVPTQSPVQQTPVQGPPVKGAPPETPAPAPEPTPAPPVKTPTPPVTQAPPVKTPPVKGGGKPPKPDTTKVRLDNHDANSSIKLHSNKRTSVEIFGDPHVRTVVDGKQRSYDIGYGPGQIKLDDGTKVKWDTYKNASHALLHFSIDAPGKARDNNVATNDGKDVRNQLTALTDKQLREFIRELGEYRGAWNQPLQHHEPKPKPQPVAQAGPVVQQGAPAKAPTKAPETYRVRAGDTLSAIARRNDVTVEQLARLNGIRNVNQLAVGQTIKLP